MQSISTPHLLLRITTPDPQQLVNVLSLRDMVLAYDGRWCCFQYTILEETVAASGMKLVVTLTNSFLHNGQFYRGQTVQLYQYGKWIANAQVEEVLEPCLHYWEHLPFEPVQKHPFSVEEVRPLISDWVTTLSGNSARMDVETTSTATAHHLVIKNATHRTLLLVQAQLICQILKEAPWACCYRVAYEPPLYGLLDLFLKDFSLTFVLHNDTHFARGTITLN